MNILITGVGSFIGGHFMEHLGKKILKWEPSINLKVGLKKTHKWVHSEFKKNIKFSSFLK